MFKLLDADFLRNFFYLNTVGFHVIMAHRKLLNSFSFQKEV